MVIKRVMFLVVAITLSRASARVITQNAMSSALQDILSPANTEKALQLIKIAAARSNKNKDLARAIPCDYPVRFASDGYLPVRGAREMPVRVVTGDGCRPVVIRPNPVREVKQVSTNLMDSLVMPKEIFQTFPVALPKEKAPLPCQACQAYNPYLPVASPVSAMSPGCLPPPTQSKGQFLRKIPIPPPTL